MTTSSTGPRSRRDSALELVFKLRDIPLFGALAADQLLPVAEVAIERRVAAGSTIFDEGDPAHHLYLLSSGEVEVLRRERRIARLGPGETFGVMALFDRTTRSATVRALTPVQAVLIARQEMSDLLELYPSLGREIARVLTRRLRAANGGIIPAVPLTES